MYHAEHAVVPSHLYKYTILRADVIRSRARMSGTSFFSMAPKKMVKMEKNTRHYAKHAIKMLKRLFYKV